LKINGLLIAAKQAGMGAKTRKNGVKGGRNGEICCEMGRKMTKYVVK
jgi:hypothetical protein